MKHDPVDPGSPVTPALRPTQLGLPGPEASGWTSHSAQRAVSPEDLDRLDASQIHPTLPELVLNRIG